MERIEPTTFKGPRAYFTNFDYRIVKKKRNRKQFRQEITRKLKVLLLTKGRIICAASHLTHPFAFQFFLDNPVLLQDGIVVPAIRRDKPDIGALFDKRTLPKKLKKEMESFYNENIMTCVNWELEDNSSWFRNNFLRELTNSKSVLRTNLGALNDKQINSLVNKIQNKSILERDTIEEETQDFPRSERRVMLLFRELLYHISGARVVNCESCLPQEEYLDYSLADMKNGDCILSEIKVFWKMFCELAFETLYRKDIPLEMIDTLSFEDILSLRQPILESDFMSKYDKMVTTSVAVSKSPDAERILYGIDELMSIRDCLSKTFSQVFEKEMAIIIKAKRIEEIKEFGKQSVAFGSGLASFVHPVAGLPSIIIAFREWWLNLWQTFKCNADVGNYDTVQLERQAALEYMIQRNPILPEAPMIDTVRRLVKLMLHDFKQI